MKKTILTPVLIFIEKHIKSDEQEFDLIKDNITDKFILNDFEKIDEIYIRQIIDTNGKKLIMTLPAMRECIRSKFHILLLRKKIVKEKGYENYEYVKCTYKQFEEVIENLTNILKNKQKALKDWYGRCLCQHFQPNNCKYLDEHKCICELNGRMFEKCRANTHDCICAKYPSENVCLEHNILVKSAAFQ